MAVRRLRVPQQGYKGFAALLSITDRQFDELLGAIRSASVPVSERAFVEQIISSIGLVEAETVTNVVELALTLHIVRTDAGYSNIDEFIEALRRGLESAAPSELPQKINWADFHSRLTQILSLDDTVGIVSKATYLSGEHEHILHNAELFTDLRPVFKSDPQQEPIGAIVTHNLKLTYHDGPDMKILFLALNSDNLQTLRTLLDRAESKANSLRSYLGAHSLPILGEDGDD